MFMLVGLCIGNMGMRLRYHQKKTVPWNNSPVPLFQSCRMVMPFFSNFSCSSWVWKNSRQAFKVIVTDPDSVLDSLTREVKEIGPDGQEVRRIP